MGIYKDKKTGLYRYDFQLHVVRYTDRGYRTRREAEAAEAKRRVEVLAGLTATWSTFSDLAKDWLKDLAGRASEAWVKQCVWKLNKYAGPISRLPPAQVKPLVVQKLLTRIACETSPKTSNEVRKILGAAFRWAVDMGGVEYNPVMRVRTLPVAPPELEVIPTADLIAVILAAEGRMSRFLTVQATSAARRIEIARLRLEDVDLDGAQPRIALRHNKGKVGRVRWRPLPPAAAEAVARQIQEGARWGWVWPGRDSKRHIGEETLRGLLAAACKRAGVPQYGFHSVRRWAATSANEAGHADKTVSTFLGHTNTAVTSRYVEVQDGAMLEIAERLERKLKIRLVV